MPKSTSFWDHPISTLEKALHIRKQIEALNNQVAELMGGSSFAGKRRGRPAKTASVESPAVKVDGRKGKRSAAARAKMAAAAKARWAAKKAAEAAPTAVVNGSKKKKRTMSPEARAKIAAAQRARWARVKG
jgi:hypothetical protein